MSLTKSGLELFRLRSRAADLVFGGALGAYVGLTFSDGSVKAGGYTNLSMLLFMLAIGVNFIILAGERLTQRKTGVVAFYISGVAIYLVLLAALSVEAGVDWKLLSSMMGAWLSYALVSGLATRSDKNEIDD